MSSTQHTILCFKLLRAVVSSIHDSWHNFSMECTFPSRSGVRTKQQESEILHDDDEDQQASQTFLDHLLEITKLTHRSCKRSSNVVSRLPDIKQDLKVAVSIEAR
jgi:hypothetical protein